MKNSRKIHFLALAGPLLVDQSSQHANGHVQRAQHVAHRGAGAGGGAIGPAGGAHQAAHGLTNDVITGALAQRARVAETGDRAVDDAGVDLFQHIVAQAQFLHRTGAVVLQHDIGLFDHLFKDLFAFRLFQVQGHADLAAVEVCVVNTVAVDKGAHLTSIVAALGVLDLDHRSTHIGHHRCCIRAREHAAQIQNNDTIQQTFHFLYTSCKN